MIDIENEPFEGRLGEIFMSLHRKILLKDMKQQKVISMSDFKRIKSLKQEGLVMDMLK